MEEKLRKLLSKHKIMFIDLSDWDKKPIGMQDLIERQVHYKWLIKKLQEEN